MADEIYEYLMREKQELEAETDRLLHILADSPDWDSFVTRRAEYFGLLGVLDRANRKIAALNNGE